MNSFKLQDSFPSFKFLVLLLVFVSLNILEVNSQQYNDVSNMNLLYDSSKAYYATGDYNSALRILNRIIILKSKIPEDINPEYFRVYNLLGIIFKKQGNLSMAIDYYKKAKEKTSDIFSLSVINGNIAIIYSLKGDYPKAIYYIENTLSVLEKSKDKKKCSYIVHNYHNLGFSYYKLGNYNLARVNYLKSIQISKENKLSENSETYFNCGLVYQKLDSLSRADCFFKKAIEFNTIEFGENHYMTGMAYMNYAAFYSDIGDYRNSTRLYKKSQNILLKSLGCKHLYTSYSFMNNGKLYYRIGNYKLALKYYQKSLISKIYNFNDSSIYTNPNADVMPDMDLLDIIKLKAQAFEKFAEQEGKEQNLKATLATLELAATFIEQLRTGYLYEGSKLQIAEREHEVYLSIVRIANSLYEITKDYKYTEIAFKYAEFSKYAVLRELKNDEMAKGVAGIPDSISVNERRIKQQIVSLRMQAEDESKLEHPNRSKIDVWNEQQFSLSQKLEGLMQRLESRYPEYYKQKYSNQVVSVTQLQKSMDKKEAILEYVLGDKELYTFAITKDTFLLVKKEADSTFRSGLDFLISDLRSPYPSDYYIYRDAAYTLYKKLIYPVESLLENKNLLIIPDGRLNLISFDVLIDKPYRVSDKPNYAKESYLLRKYPIGYAYSATLYSNSLSSIHRGSPDFLGIAPDYKNSKDSLRSIPMGLRSVRRTALLTFGKSLIGSNATEANFKKYCGRYGVVHFYAHGLEDTLNPANSKLALSTPTDSADDGYLHAWEVYNMQLNAQMVVLGSCYSGSGKISKGEGVLSMSRSFMFAGSQSVVMSLWSAYDGSTNDMLNDFYMNLFKGMRKDEALRLAKLKYLGKENQIFVSPRFWSGIVVNGNQNALYHYWFLKKVLLIATIIVTLTLLVWKRKAIRRLAGSVVN